MPARNISLFIVWIMVLALSIPAYARIKTYTYTIRQPFGGSQSPDDARIAGIARAKREILEMAGTYLETLTIVKQGKLDKDDIIALAAGVLKVEVVSQKNYASGDAFGIEIKVKADVDTSILEKRIKQLLEDRQWFEKYKESTKREKELLARVKQLEEENKRLMALQKKEGRNEKKKKKLKQEFKKTSNELLAEKYFLMAQDNLFKNKSFDTKLAIQLLTKAIELNPKYADAYGTRGIAYSFIKQYSKAIKDFNKAIELNPEDDGAYLNRGTTYADLGQYSKAIKDYSKAIELNPEDAWAAYYNRGLAYDNLGQYSKAIKDYNKAIELTPELELVYDNLGQDSQEMKDWYKSAELQVDKVKNISLEDVRQYFVTNEKIGNIFVLEGKAVNRFNKPKELIKLRATLYDDKGNVFKTKEFYCGNTVSLFQLQVLTQKELEASLNTKLGILTNNTFIKPGGSTPFMVVFYALPENVQEFGLEVIDVKDPPKK